MTASMEATLVALNERLAHLERENATLRQLVQTVVSEGCDTDLIGTANGKAVLFLMRGGWKLQLPNRTWTTALDFNELLAALTLET